MAQRKKRVYRLIYFLPLLVVCFFVILGFFFERTFVRAATLKPIVIGADNVTAKLYRLDAGASGLGPESEQATAGADTSRTEIRHTDRRQAAGKYLLVLNEVDGRRVEGYFIHMGKKKMGYANFSKSFYRPLVGCLAIVNRDVLNECKPVDELKADFQNIPQGVMITPKGPAEMAYTLDDDVEKLYRKRLIYKKTILLESNN
ncbi:MAG: hypothetical protein JW749_02405 [Sedimentisphaerales bacterium]|nr:hypothetical protein [Sedimentisphaerales bacterium]